MITMKSLSKILPFVLIIGCSHFGKKSESKQSTDNVYQARLRKYLASRPSLNLPIAIDGSVQAILANDTTSVQMTDWMHFYVSQKLHKIFENDSICVMISYHPAGAGGLSLQTMDKLGNHIDGMGLFGGYEANPAHQEMENAKVFSDLSVVVNKTITSYQVDSFDIPNPATKSVSVEAHKYQILGSGKIKQIE